MIEQASAFVTGGIGALAVVMALIFLLIDRAVRIRGEGSGPPTWKVAAGVGVWMAITAGAAASGVLRHYHVIPPPLMVLMVLSVTSGVMLGMSPVGNRWVDAAPLAWVVGLMTFRLPLEVVMEEAAQSLVMPYQLSFRGFNFDIFTACLALVVAPLLARGWATSRLVWVWNAVGWVTLTVIGILAILLSPMVHFFGQEPDQINTWVTHFPFVWLPSVLVSLAIFGHVVVTRKLIREGQRSSTSV